MGKLSAVILFSLGLLVPSTQAWAAARPHRDPAAVPAEEMPLIAPSKRRPKEPPRSEATPPPAIAAATPQAEPNQGDGKSGLIIGAKLGAGVGMAGPLGASVFAAVELGYRLPAAGRLLGVSLEPSFGNPSAAVATPLGFARGPASWLSVPLLVSANVALGPGLLRVFAGPSIDAIWSHSEVAGFRHTDAVVSLGAAVGAGYFFNLGPGALGVDVRYRATSVRVTGADALTHSMAVAAGYLFLL